MRTAAFSSLLSPGLFHVLVGHKKRKPLTYRQWMNVKSMNRNFIDDSVITTLGPMRLKGESVTVPLDDPVQAGTRRYTPDAFQLGYAISREMKADNLYDDAIKGAKALVNSVNQRVETDAFAVLNNGFTTTVSTWNNQSLFNASHTLAKSGGTQRNTRSTDLDLGAFQQSLDDIALMTGHEGFPLNLEGKLLICHTNNRWMAQELTESELKPHTANNEINALLGMGLQFIASPFVTDTDSWFVLTPPEDHTLRFVWRQEPLWETWDDPATGETIYQVYMRETTGATDHFGAWGSPGA